MIDRLLSHIAPHLCCGCRNVGTLLCDNCKYDITSEYFVGCVACGSATGGRGVCTMCRVPYARAWCVGERSGNLRQLIDDYKFEHKRASYSPLAELLDGRIEQLPTDTVIIPVPTISSHIRQRGYDHTLLIAKALAKRRNLKISRALQKTTSTRQRGVDRATRIAQAKEAFVVRGKLEADHPYLLIDDITTTGATLLYATRALREAGASDVWVAVIARQPLD